MKRSDATNHEKLPRLAIVVPCYNEEEVLPLTEPRLRSLIEGMVDAGKVSADSFVLYVDDGSRDATWSIIAANAEEYPCDAGLKLAGNVGHQNALLAGLDAVSGIADITVSIDADLQDDIRAIEKMVDRYAEGYDIVYGVRRSRRTDTWFKRNSALAFYRLMRRMGVKTVFNHADFRLMSARAVHQLMQYREANLFLRGIVPKIGYKQCSVEYDRSAREAGESKYPLGKMISFAVEGITSFSTRPVKMVLSVGLLFLLIAFCIFIYVLYSIFTRNAVSGWASLMLSIWFCSGVLMLSLGVIGEYVGKIYFEVKERPRYNMEHIVGVESKVHREV